MTDRQYYSVRTGKNPYGTELDLTILSRLFADMFIRLKEAQYFQEAFGFYCVDDGFIAGTLGADIDAQMLRRLRKPNLWPIQEKCQLYSEDDLFDVIEFLFDYISKPIDGYFHDWDNCGWHYKVFDKEEGRKEFHKEINEYLRDYKSGYELSMDGEILALPEIGMETLFTAALPSYNEDNVNNRLEIAVRKFRNRHASPEERRDAIRDLADVLEFLRPKLQSVITRKDENDLFNIANNFGIRHHNDSQKTDYEKSIWYSWMFYYYLATIHAVVRLIQREENV